MTWKVHRKSDGADMEIEAPGVFSIGATQLSLTHSASDFAQRLTLFDSGTEFYFEGTVSANASPSTTS